MNWTKLKKLPEDFDGLFSVEMDDDKITTIIIDLPEHPKIKLKGNYYTDAIEILGEAPPEEVEIYEVRDDGFNFRFRYEGNAETFAQKMGAKVKSLNVLEDEISGLKFCDADQIPDDGIPF